MVISKIRIALLYLLVLAAGTVIAHAENKEYSILNAHEHIESIEAVPNLLAVMDAHRIEKTLLVGSPEATFRTEETGFWGEDQNNQEVLKIVQSHPQRFLFFPTLNPEDPQKLEKLKEWISRGGNGLKLYYGGQKFHNLPLDHPTMWPVYEYCQKEQIPILMHVNAGLYLDEFENVLRRFPGLKVTCPHFCLSSINTGRFEYLMDTYPGLYTDISFGPIDYLKTGLLRISRDPVKFRALFDKYQDRIVFGTDLVISREPHKTREWLSLVTAAYRDILEKETYEFIPLKGLTLHGLHLPPEILNKIYRENFIRFTKKTQ